MSTLSLILSIAASIGTIISLIWNGINTKKINNKINNSKSIQSRGGKGNYNATGNNNKF